MITPLADTSTHVNIPFRNPVLNPTTAIVARGTMVSLEIADALGSAACFRRGGHETDPVMRPFSHNGALGMAIGFAAVDYVEHFIGKRLHINGAIIDFAQASKNVQGIIQTGQECH